MTFYVTFVAVVFSNGTLWSDLGVQVCNPAVRKAEAGGPQGLSLPGLK